MPEPIDFDTQSKPESSYFAIENMLEPNDFDIKTMQKSYVQLGKTTEVENACMFYMDMDIQVTGNNTEKIENDCFQPLSGPILKETSEGEGTDTYMDANSYTLGMTDQTGPTSSRKVKEAFNIEGTVINTDAKQWCEDQRQPLSYPVKKTLKGEGYERNKEVKLGAGNQEELNEALKVEDTVINKEAKSCMRYKKRSLPIPGVKEAPKGKNTEMNINIKSCLKDLKEPSSEKDITELNIEAKSSKRDQEEPPSSPALNDKPSLWKVLWKMFKHVNRVKAMHISWIWSIHLVSWILLYFLTVNGVNAEENTVTKRTIELNIERHELRFTFCGDFNMAAGNIGLNRNGELLCLNGAGHGINCTQETNTKCVTVTLHNTTYEDLLQNYSMTLQFNTLATFNPSVDPIFDLKDVGKSAWTCSQAAPVFAMNVLHVYPNVHFRAVVDGINQTIEVNKSQTGYGMLYQSRVIFNLMTACSNCSSQVYYQHAVGQEVLIYEGEVPSCHTSNQGELPLVAIIVPVVVVLVIFVALVLLVKRYTKLRPGEFICRLLDGVAGVAGVVRGFFPVPVEERNEDNAL